MTASAHAVIGAAIAAKISNPLVALPIILASHFLCDKVPHWDPMTDKGKTQKQIIKDTIFDVIFGFIVVGCLWQTLWSRSNGAYLFLSAFIAQLPDWLEMPKLLLGWNLPGSNFNYQVQKWVHDVWFDARLAAPWGIITQLTVTSAFLLWSLS